MLLIPLELNYAVVGVKFVLWTSPTTKNCSFSIAPPFTAGVKNSPHPGALAPNLETKVGNLYINQTQYFGNVPEVAFNFYIGGYQPAQKWLKDRKGRTLTNSDLEHYQKIIIALTETDRLMKEINKIEIE